MNEAALLVSFENRIDEKIHTQVMALQEALNRQPFRGFTESVPAYASLAVFYDLWQVKESSDDKITAFEKVRTYLEQLIGSTADNVSMTERRTISIPVFYNGEDLSSVAAGRGLTEQELVRIHCEKVYRVFMIGFLPGFAYMGPVDERIATPRHASPRLAVKPGSVGIAGAQTGIYPITSPGGWQLIGQTPIKIFDAAKEPPCLLQAGDSVQFVSISKQEFEKLNEY